jgi:hypothetical protein
LIAAVYETMAREVASQLSVMSSRLLETLDAKAKQAEGEGQWDNINEHYEKFSSEMDQLFQFSSGFFSVVTLYAQTFAVFKVKTNLLP